MSAPVVTWMKYVTATAAYSEIGTGQALTLNSITAGSWTRGVGLRIKFSRDTAFTIGTVRLWMNDCTADVNGGSVVLTAWTARYLYTSGVGALTASSRQTLTCPAAVLTAGSHIGFATLPSAKRGNVASEGVDLGLTSTWTEQQSFYTKHVGISFKPNATAQDGTYSNFSIQVAFSFQ